MTRLSFLTRLAIGMIAALLVIALVKPAHAEEVTHDQLAKACSYSFTALHVTDSTPLPQIVEDDAELYHIAAGLELVNPERVMALYMIGRIYVHSYFDASWMPYLAHECTHYAQVIMQVKYPCHAAQERLAYEIQNRYAFEHNQPVRYSYEWIKKHSKCEGE